ncbi:MAG: VWA domain-containing protein [Stappiaceae bacterium]
MSLPQASQVFVDFAALLRAHGFAVAPDQTMAFIQSVGLLGPRSLEDIRLAALSMLAIRHERQAEFDALFRAFFLGQTVAAAAADSEDEEDVSAYEETGEDVEIPDADEPSEIGAEATSAEMLGRRDVGKVDIEEHLQRLMRLGPSRLPRRLSYRRTGAKRGDRLDMRRMLRRAVQRDGEVTDLAFLKRKTWQRRLVLLIDVSGSMKEQSDQTLQFAHALSSICDRFEAFTFGTRLTRITAALSVKNRQQALIRASRLVADFDGGTRIGEALQAFLAVPRYAGFTRGAVVLVISDGLERGSPNAMIDAVWRMSRIAWRVDWLTPLASDQGYEPKTEALSTVLPYLTSLSDGSRTEALCDHVLTMTMAKTGTRNA